MKSFLLVGICITTLLSCKTTNPINYNIDTNTQKKITTMTLDTSALIQNIVADKAKYIGKELGGLFNDLPLPIKTAILLRGNKIGMYNGLMLSFDKRESTYGNQRVLDVTFETKITNDILVAGLKENRSNTGWNGDMQEFYSKQIVKDVLCSFCNIK